MLRPYVYWGFADRGPLHSHHRSELPTLRSQGDRGL